MALYDVYLIDDDGNEEIVKVDVVPDNSFDSPEHFIDSALFPAVRELGYDPDHIEDWLGVGGDEED